MSLSKIAAAALFVLALAFSSVPVAAHDASTFTILIRDDGITPANASIRFNDTAWWINIGEDDNLTHRIVYDGDGDGNYSGPGDWDSGELSNSCERDENGTKLDDECQTSFELGFNGTFGPGTYHYQDLLSNGTANDATLVVTSDTHLSPGFQQPQEQPDTEEEEEERPAWLLAVAGISALGAAVLGYMVLQGQPKG